MGKLYEVLAVEGDAQGRATKLVNETKQVFSNKENLFKGKVRTLALFDQDVTKETEIKALEAKDSTAIRVESTIPDSLNYMACIIGDYWDLMFQKEATNQVAKADIIIGGALLLKDVPVTFLLCMENRLKDLRPVLEAIPTLAPGIAWDTDESYGRHIWQAPETNDVKTKEDIEYRIIAPATDKHPAQVQPVKTQFNIGKYTTKEWSGLISSAEKADLLEKFDKVVRAIKEARQRANAVEAVTTKVSDTLLTALIGDWFNRELMNPQVVK
jgi:hypothetical protein